MGPNGELLADAGKMGSRCPTEQHQPRGQNEHDYDTYGERGGKPAPLFAILVLSGLWHFSFFLAAK